MEEQPGSPILAAVPEGTAEGEVITQNRYGAIRSLFEQGHTKKAIARELGLDPKTALPEAGRPDGRIFLLALRLRGLGGRSFSFLATGRLTRSRLFFAQLRRDPQGRGVIPVGLGFFDLSPLSRGELPKRT